MKICFFVFFKNFDFSFFKTVFFDSIKFRNIIKIKKHQNVQNQNLKNVISYQNYPNFVPPCSIFRLFSNKRPFLQPIHSGFHAARKPNAHVPHDCDHQPKNDLKKLSKMTVGRQKMKKKHEKCMKFMKNGK